MTWSPGPWRLAFAADPALPPLVHVLVELDAHVNLDLPQALLASRRGTTCSSWRPPDDRDPTRTPLATVRGFGVALPPA